MYVDYTLKLIDNFLTSHLFQVLLNSIDPHIQITVESEHNFFSWRFSYEVRTSFPNFRLYKKALLCLYLLMLCQTTFWEIRVHSVTHMFVSCVYQYLYYRQICKTDLKTFEYTHSCCSSNVLSLCFINITTSRLIVYPTTNET